MVVGGGSPPPDVGEELEGSVVFDPDGGLRYGFPQAGVSEGIPEGNPVRLICVGPEAGPDAIAVPGGLIRTVQFAAWPFWISISVLVSVFRLHISNSPSSRLGSTRVS